MPAFNSLTEKTAAAMLALVLSVVTLNATVQTPNAAQAQTQFAGAYVSVVA